MHKRWQKDDEERRRKQQRNVKVMWVPPTHSKICSLMFKMYQTNNHQHRVLIELLTRKPATTSSAGWHCIIPNTQAKKKQAISFSSSFSFHYIKQKIYV